MKLTPLASQINSMAQDGGNDLFQLSHNLRRPAFLPLHQPVLPTPLIPPVDPDGIQPRRLRTHNIERVPAHEPDPLQIIFQPHLPRQVHVRLTRRLVLPDLVNRDDVPEDVGLVFEVRRARDAVGDHFLRAVGEDDGVDIGGRAQLAAQAGDVGEDAEGVVGFQEALEVLFGEGEGVLGEGVFQ